VLIVSTNIARRNLSKGQQAIALALMFPESEKGGRGKKSDAVKAIETTGFSRSRLDQARTILRHSIDLAHSVRDGGRHFDEALAEVKDAEQIRRRLTGVTR
jgi:hypothetical protein